MGVYMRKGVGDKGAPQEELRVCSVDVVPELETDVLDDVLSLPRRVVLCSPANTRCVSVCMQTCTNNMIFDTLAEHVMHCPTRTHRCTL